MSATSWFETVPNIPYEGPNSDNPLAFTHYNADEMVAGKTMRDHLRFAVCYWHAMRGTGADPLGWVAGRCQGRWPTTKCRRPIKPWTPCLNLSPSWGLSVLP